MAGPAISTFPRLFSLHAKNTQPLYWNDFTLSDGFSTVLVRFFCAVPNGTALSIAYWTSRGKWKAR